MLACKACKCFIEGNSMTDVFHNSVIDGDVVGKDIVGKVVNCFSSRYIISFQEVMGFLGNRSGCLTGSTFLRTKMRLLLELRYVSRDPQRRTDTCSRLVDLPYSQ